MSPEARPQEAPKAPHYRPKTVRLGDVLISRFILGGNPFGGYAHQTVEPDFFMTCYYNPSDRTRAASRDYGEEEYFGEEDRESMCALIQQLPAPAIHYKVLAAGRNNPRQAFEYVADVYRPGDAVCVGIFTKDKEDMIQEDVDLLEAALQARGK